MNKWFSSLQFRVLVGFAFALGLVVLGLILFASVSIDQETQRFQKEVTEAEAGRTREKVIQNSRESGYVGADEKEIIIPPVPTWHILIRDSKGRVIAHSQEQVGVPDWDDSSAAWVVPIYGEEGDTQVGEAGRLMIRPVSLTVTEVEPPPSRLISAFRRSVLWAGLAVGGIGVASIFLVTRRILVPVRHLTLAVGKMAQGDFLQRVPVKGQGEIGQLAQTFNDMASELERAEKHRKQLIADVAHELRTPLTNARGYVEAIKDGLMSPEGEAIEAIYRQVDRLSKLVDDLRLLSLAESGYLELNLEPDSIPELLRSTVESFEPLARAKGVDIHLDCQGYLPLVMIDRARIDQVASNLIRNAIFHTPSGGSVKLRAYYESDKVFVVVSDSGEGIPEDALPYVFERFYRSDRSRSRSSGGTGLGLAIARQLIEAHGGAIRVSSVLGKGSEFTFSMPLISPALQLAIR